jgi:hypothetical protein
MISIEPESFPSCIRGFDSLRPLQKTTCTSNVSPQRKILNRAAVPAYCGHRARCEKSVEWAINNYLTSVREKDPLVRESLLPSSELPS